MMPSPRRQPTEEYDLSSIQPPVKLGISGAEQVARCLAGGSDEIKHLLQQECRLIFECCVCTGLFRSLANFLAHKRVYCKEDHMLPSSDLASHVSILRQYIQTKAAAMATLAEGANNQSSPTGSNLGTPPEEFVGSAPMTPPRVHNGTRTDQKEADLGEIPKKKKVKSGASQKSEPTQVKSQRVDQAQLKGQHNAILMSNLETDKDSASKEKEKVNGKESANKEKEKVNGREKLKSAEKLKSTDKLKTVEKSVKIAEKLKSAEKSVKPAEKLKSAEKLVKTAERVKSVEKSLKSPERVKSVEKSVKTPEKVKSIEKSVKAPERVKSVEKSVKTPDKVKGVEKSMKTPDKVKSGEKLMKTPDKVKSVEKCMKTPEKVKSIEKPSTSGLKKRRFCDTLPNNIKPPQIKRKFLGTGGDACEELNGPVNLATEFFNHADLAIGANGDRDCSKKGKTLKGKALVSIKPMECIVVMKEADMVVPPTVTTTVAEKPLVVKALPFKTPKTPKKDLAQHLLYPCLYCDNVFPGTRMAIDHISAIHKKRKTINVSKIRTKIRKKAFVVKSGQKTRRFQKSSKSLESKKSDSDVEYQVPHCITLEDDRKVGRRSQLSYLCSQCSKVYLYKTAMERHQLTCIGNQKLAESPNNNQKLVESPNSVAGVTITAPLPRLPLSPAPTPKNNKGLTAGTNAATPAGSTSITNHKMMPEKKSATKHGASPVTVSPPEDCDISDDELEISSGSTIKSEPDNPFDSLLIEPGLEVASTSSAGTRADDSPFVIPVKSEYPCPYCMVKARKTFDLLFQHISTKHKNLRPSRKRVARFLMNSGYRCTWCRDPPRFFKNRVILRRHRVKEHGMKYTRTAAQATAREAADAIYQS